MSSNKKPLEGENVNPTANGEAPGKKSWIPGLGGSNKHGATVDVPLDDPRKRERDLSAWEEELKRREQNILKREGTMNRAGVTIEEKNWPPFYPVIHHDITNEIPIHAQKLQYAAFASFLGLVLCLGWNVLATFFQAVRWGDTVVFLLAVIYLISGCPLSYILWYKPLYEAMRHDSMVTFLQFFVFYSMHVLFCIIASFAPPIIFRGKSLTGIFASIEVLSGDIFLGIIYLAGFILFTVETLISIWVLQREYMYFRGHR